MYAYIRCLVRSGQHAIHKEVGDLVFIAGLLWLHFMESWLVCAEGLIFSLLVESRKARPGGKS